MVSLTQIREEVMRMSDEEQRNLMSLLVSIQTSRNQAFQEKLARKIDNHDPNQWVELDDLKGQFGAGN